MNWKFSCESKSDIPLPPDYTFPRALNYLNSENNSFFTLENENGYIQCGGSRKECTVEFREYGKKGKFTHYVLYNSGGSEDEVQIAMSNGIVNRKIKHCFGFLTAAELFACYFENKGWPNGIEYEDITSQFN